MRRILKFPISPNINNMVVMPKGATITHVAEQHGNPTMWAECDTDQPPETRMFVAISTGFDTVPENTTFVGTSVGPQFVWHIYEIANGVTEPTIRALNGIFIRRHLPP